MIGQTHHYAIRATVAMDFPHAVTRAREELAHAGFGVLCEIDVAATMKQKLNVDMPPYVILGACNPPLAHQALTAERDIGLLLPCNVVVYEEPTPGTCVVAAIDPVEALRITANSHLLPIAEEVRERLARVIEAVERAAPVH